jgi:hypothetical protein
MASLADRPLQRTGLRASPEWLSLCLGRRVRTVGELLKGHSELELAEELDVHRNELKHIIELAVSEGGAPPFRTAFQLLQREFGLAPEADLMEDEAAAADEQQQQAATNAAAKSPAAASMHAQAASSADAAVAAHALLEAVNQPRAFLSLARSLPALRINKGITEVRATSILASLQCHGGVLDLSVSLVLTSCALILLLVSCVASSLDLPALVSRVTKHVERSSGISRTLCSSLTRWCAIFLLFLLFAAAGKTQACLTLCADCYLPPHLGGLGGGVVYIDTENTFHGDRSAEIASAARPFAFQCALER